MDTRERILEAAGKLFAEIGYARATTRAIAEAAGVNEITVFRHFGSKQKLLMAFVEQFNARGFPGTLEQHLTGDYRQDIRRMAQAQLENTLANLQLLRVMVCDMLALPDIRGIALAGAQHNHQLLVRYFQRQIDAGIVRNDLPADALVQAFDGMFSSGLLMQAFFQASLTPAIPTETLLDHLSDIFVQGTLKRPN